MCTARTTFVQRQSMHTRMSAGIRYTCSTVIQAHTCCVFYVCVYVCQWHPASTCGIITDIQCMDWLISSLNRAHQATAPLAGVRGVVTVMECMAGKTQIGSTFAQLKYIIDRVDDPSRMGVCIDTCHAFAAGMDLRTCQSVDELLATFDRIIGLQYLRAFHLNDSKGELGCHRDRHESIGLGCIGVNGFHALMNHPSLDGLPLILETPCLDPRQVRPKYSAEIDALYQMQQGALPETRSGRPLPMVVLTVEEIARDARRVGEKLVRKATQRRDQRAQGLAKRIVDSKHTQQTQPVMHTGDGLTLNHIQEDDDDDDAHAADQDDDSLVDCDAVDASAGEHKAEPSPVKHSVLELRVKPINVAAAAALTTTAVNTPSSAASPAAAAVSALSGVRNLPSTAVLELDPASLAAARCTTDPTDRALVAFRVRESQVRCSGPTGCGATYVCQSACSQCGMTRSDASYNLSARMLYAAMQKERGLKTSLELRRERKRRNDPRNKAKAKAQAQAQAQTQTQTTQLQQDKSAATLMNNITNTVTPISISAPHTKSKEEDTLDCADNISVTVALPDAKRQRRCNSSPAAAAAAATK